MEHSLADVKVGDEVFHRTLVTENWTGYPLLESCYGDQGNQNTSVCWRY